MVAPRHRVIVQIAGRKTEYGGKTARSLDESSNTAKRRIGVLKSGSKGSPKAVLEMVDKRTLQLSMVDPGNKVSNFSPQTQMHFDCVGKPRDPNMTAEFSSMLDQMIVKHTNCCLMLFRHDHECQLVFLTSLLVTEFKKHLISNDVNIRHIKLEFFEIRKLHTREAESQIKNRFRSRCQFNSMQDFYKWFYTEYITWCSVNKEHECFDIEYELVNSRQNTFKVQFALLQLFVGILDEDTKIDLRSYFERMREERRSRHYSLLTYYIRNYFRGADLYTTWLHFDLTSPKLEAAAIDDLLNFARAAYSSNKTGETSSQQDSHSDSQLQVNGGGRDTELLRPVLDLLTTFTSSTFQATISDQKPLPEFHDDKFLDICSWYDKMESKFRKLIEAMENYYQAKANPSLLQNYEEIVSAMGAVGTLEHLMPKSATRTAKKTECTESEALQYYFFQYKEAVSSFRDIVRQVEQSQYVEALRTCIGEVCNKLLNYALELKANSFSKEQSRILKHIVKRETH